jgi:hypothetical protein
MTRAVSGLAGSLEAAARVFAEGLALAGREEFEEPPGDLFAAPAGVTPDEDDRLDRGAAVADDHGAGRGGVGARAEGVDFFLTFALFVPLGAIEEVLRLLVVQRERGAGFDELRVQGVELRGDVGGELGRAVHGLDEQVAVGAAKVFDAGERL